LTTFRKADEDSAQSSLRHVIPAHEGFHFMMCMADVEAELFRNNSRGLQGGSFSTATLLNRKKAKLCKGKEAVDEIKDFIDLKGSIKKLTNDSPFGQI